MQTNKDYWRRKMEYKASNWLYRWQVIVKLLIIAQLITFLKAASCMLFAVFIFVTVLSFASTPFS
jgi:uncharacterized membrane protein YkgB